MARNVLGGDLECCCLEPVTGFYRNGKCDTGGGDHGLHTVCTEVTEEFLEFARSQGNDLMTPMPEYGFAGLKPGNKWCVCVGTVMQAIQAGKPPLIHLRATHVSVLEFLDMDVLKSCAIDVSE